jgi:hypothetical protein
MKSAYTWPDLPEITVLTASILGLVWQGAIRVREKHVIDDVLYPDRLFVGICALPDVPHCAVQALGRMIFLLSAPRGRTPQTSMGICGWRHWSFLLRYDRKNPNITCSS